MCRYAFKVYKPHYACFRCKKIFKKVAMEDYFRQRGKLQMFLDFLNKSHVKKRNRELMERYGTSLQELKDEYRAEICRCPECGEDMADIGLDLRAPKKSDLKAWKIIQDMYTYGRRFKSCGCEGAGFIPANPREYREVRNR